MPRWIQTYSGRKFYPLEPRAGDLDIRDIAHALALKTRFGGHGREFYSVADHCVRVSRIVRPECALWGLMHDAAEAYLADVPRPVKALWPAFVEAEEKLLEVVARRFGMCWPMPREVCEADDILLATEARDLMNGGAREWNLRAMPLPRRVIPLTWSESEGQFLARFTELAQSC